MQKVTTPVSRCTTIAMALFSALAGQAAIAAVSSNIVGPIYGRQIVMDAPPTITAEGNGIVGTNVMAIVPSVTDMDDDALEDWKYVWKVDGVEIGAETNAGSVSNIPEFTVQADNAGKKLELCLRAVAEVRSFPESTRYSEQLCSTTIDLISSMLVIADPGAIIVNENEPFSLSLVVSSDNPSPIYEWELNGGADANLFNIVKDTGELTMSAKDFEEPEDSDTNNSYIVDVKVTDTVSGAMATIELAINVVNVIKDIVNVEVVDTNGVAIVGNPLVGTVLHTKVTLDDGNGFVIDSTNATYQWQRNGKAVGQNDTWIDITNATSATYTVTAEDQGYEIRVDANGK
ncbi:hypothetical protein GL272_14050 [Aeromonas veronii]|uniref:hypothetical protein n=1 Tax=Aeromonas veronii TaxID=654 RepID=UPI00130220E1|nr:hypothetical protein [Aeromonas veronii]KAE9625319.1 hypothetical protein GO627_07960 [Aeromonas veronii]MBW3778030.1 hypothetical protein [Aeromonas veronii]